MLIDESYYQTQSVEKELTRLIQENNIKLRCNWKFRSNLPEKYKKSNYLDGVEEN